MSLNDEIQNPFLSPILVTHHAKRYFKLFNPLQPGVAFIYPLKTSENLKVF